MVEITKGRINYYDVVHGFEPDSEGREHRLILCCDDIGDDREQVKAIIGNTLFEIHNFEGGINIYPISGLVSAYFEKGNK